MSSFSLLSSLDGLSPPPLKGQRSSWVGVVGSLLLITLLLWIFIPATQDYFSGNYYQSLFTTNANFTQSLYSRDDYKLALALRHKVTGAFYNHQAVLENLQASLIYNNVTSFYQEALMLCQRDYFVKDINGVQLKDCLMAPDYVKFDAIISGNTFRSISLVIQAPDASNPFYSTTFTPSLKELMFSDLLANYYCEFYFTSKVVRPNGTTQFQLHRAYSTSINVASDSIGGNLQVFAGMRMTLMDDSIMPWRNNRNITLMSYSGNIVGLTALNTEIAATSGAQQTLRMSNSLEVAVRYYKKLDWLLGVIGGGMFILFAIFWVVFSYYSRQIAQFELAQQLLLQKITNDNPRSEEDLIPIKIPWYYMLRRLLPFCREQKYEFLLQEAERYNDITLLLKKIKVAKRNLARHDMIPERYDSKIIEFPELDRIHEEETSMEASSKFQSENHQDRQVYGQLPDESLVNVQLPQTGNEGPSVVDLDEDGISGENGNEELEVPGEREREVHLEASHNPIMNQQLQAVQAPKVPNAPLSKKENPLIESGLLPPHPQPDSSHLPHVHLPPVQPLHPLPPQAIIINNQLHLDLPPQQQVIIIGTQQQLAEYNRNQAMDLPRDPSLLSDPQPLPSTNVPSIRDDKFNLTSQQLTFLRTTDDPKVLGLFENNPTFHAMREVKAPCFPDVMELQEYDRWEGHFSLKFKKCLTRFTSQLASLFTALDPFSVRVHLLDLSGSTTCCGILLTLTIVVLSVLTFALTIGNMGNTQYIISQNYIPADQVSFARLTDNDFNAVICFSKPSVFLGGGRLATFSYFTNTDGNVQTYTPVMMAPNDPALNLIGNVKFMTKAVNLSSCFRMPMGIPVKIDGSGSHFGFTFTPYCGSTPSFCNNSQFLTNSNFLTALTNNPFVIYLPGSRLDSSSNNLFTDVFTAPYIYIDFIPITQYMALEETVFTNQVRLFDDTGNGFFRQAPPVKDLNINAGYNTRRPYVKAGLSHSPSYTYRVKLNQASTDYTVTHKKADWILGIIGGVCVFWYAVVHLLGKLYMRFNFNAHVAKVIYDQDGFDEGIVMKLLAMLPIPRCLLPRCMEIRNDCDRVRAVDKKMQDTLTHLNILKYVDNCFRFSSVFFSCLQAKNISLLYFKEKIFDDEQVRLSTKRTEKPPPTEDELIDVDLQDDLALDRQNQVTNSLLQLDSLRNNQDNAAFTKEQLEIAKLMIEHEGKSDHIIDQNPSTSFTNHLDFFPEPHSFSFRGSRVFSSVTGGLCCLLMVLLIILVVIFQVSMYLNNAGVTTSYDISMDDGIDSTGITLTTGSNFKIAVAFLDINTLQPVDPSPYLSTVGISILQQQFTRIYGSLIPNITVTDLLPCPTGYIESWMAASKDASSFARTGITYCPPDGLVLSLLGQPQSLQFRSFKVSIYNKAGNALGQDNISKLLNTTYVKLYFSSPRQNSISRTVNYQMQQIVYAGVPAFTPFQTNVTLSRSEITYDDSHFYQSSPLNSSIYTFQPYNQQWLGYRYYGPATGSLWFNISFSNTFKLHSYTITAPKLYQAFGITGGVIAFFYCLIACCVIPFNRYKLRYEIGRQLYHFDKRRITETKQKVKVKLRKNNHDQKRMQQLNGLSELRILEAFLLRPLGWVSGNYNFNETLRGVTLVQDRVTRDLDFSQLYLSLYTLRDAISKRIRKDINPPINLLDVFFKKIVNPNPNAFTIDRLRNYAKQHQLSSYEQMVVARAMEARIRIQEIFDSKFLENVFNFVDDGRSIRLDMMGDTQGSVNSSISSSLTHSVGENSVDQTGREEADK